jgi:methionyl-tRNA formyltransferase
MGTPHAAVPTLERLLTDGHEVVAVWTQPDRPAGRGNNLTASPVKEFALKHNLPVYQPAKIKTAEAAALFASHEADAAIVVAYGRILPASFLSAPRFGCINVHFSLLPKLRGAAPVQWAIARGEAKTGVTTMLMDEGLDTGAILLQERTPIGALETATELMTRLAEMGAGILSRTLANLEAIEPREQEHEAATFAPVLRREDGQIEWTRAAAEIERMTRGFQPFPTAYTTHDGRRLIIWRAEVVKETQDTFSPGEVISARGSELIVACGDGTQLRLEEVQPEGKRRLTVRDFLNGARIALGEKFG